MQVFIKFPPCRKPWRFPSSSFHSRFVVCHSKFVIQSLSFKVCRSKFVVKGFPMRPANRDGALGLIMDGGNFDRVKVVVPILDKYRFEATFFVTAGPSPANRISPCCPPAPGVFPMPGAEHAGGNARPWRLYSCIWGAGTPWDRPQAGLPTGRPREQRQKR
jgi:hypothetical protein